MKYPVEITELKYWVHILIIAVITLAVLQYFTKGDMLSIKNILWSIPILAGADFIAHFLTGLK